MAVKSLVPLSVMAQVMALFESCMRLYPQGWASADFLITDLCCTERCPLNSKSFLLHLVKLNLKEYIFHAQQR